MKLKDIARTHPEIDIEKLEKYLWKSETYGSFIRNTRYGIELDDNINVDRMLLEYTAEEAEENIEEQLKNIDEEERRLFEEKRKEEIEKRNALATMLISSGFNFEGYRIVKYSGYISGDDAIQVDRGMAGWFSKATNVGDSLMASLTKIRQHALAELKEAAYALGCNAVIGVDFDYLTLDPQTANSSGGTTYLPYVFGVTANGNAVIIEKIEDDEDE